MRKWNLPLTYAPKIEPVIDGTCTQTIRALKPGKPKKEVGDLIRFYTWTGTPYRSKRNTITEYMPVIFAKDITIFPSNITFSVSEHHTISWCWEYWEVAQMAKFDGIVPPTGEALRDVLMSKNKISAEGVEAQIIRWKP